MSRDRPHSALPDRLGGARCSENRINRSRDGLGIEHRLLKA